MCAPRQGDSRQNRIRKQLVGEVFPARGNIVSSGYRWRLICLAIIRPFRLQSAPRDKLQAAGRRQGIRRDLASTQIKKKKRAANQTKRRQEAISKSAGEIIICNCLRVDVALLTRFLQGVKTLLVNEEDRDECKYLRTQRSSCRTDTSINIYLRVNVTNETIESGRMKIRLRFLSIFN